MVLNYVFDFMGVSPTLGYFLLIALPLSWYSIGILSKDQVKNYVKSEDKSCSNIYTISVLNPELFDFYVYEMADGSLRIEGGAHICR